MKDYFICPDCGHSVIGERPDHCTICASTKTILSDHDHLLHLQEMTIQDATSRSSSSQPTKTPITN